METCGWKTKKLAQRGVPDLLAWSPASGKVCLIECKTKKAKLRETQDWPKMGLPVLIMRCAEDVFKWHGLL